MARIQSNQHMYVVGDSSDLLRNTSKTLNDSSQKSMDPRPPFGSNQSRTIFCAKNNMVMEGKMSRRHCQRIFLRPCRGGNPDWMNRWLAPPANFRCASG